MILKADSTFSFGKFKGRGVLNTWTGKCNSDNSLVLRSYLRELLEFAIHPSKGTIGKIYPCFMMEIVNKEFEQIKKNSPHFSIFVGEKLIIIDKVETKDKNLVKEILETVLNCNLEETNKSFQPYPSIPFFQFTPESKGIAQLIAEPDYFHYCINNFENHCFEPKFLEQLNQIPSNFLTGFEFNYLRENIIEYSPKFSTSQSSFSTDILKINEIRYENYF